MNLPKGYKNTEVGIIPDEWEVSTIGQEFEIQLGKMIDSAKNTGIPKPYLNNKAVQWGRIEIGDLPTIPMSRVDLERFRLRRGDLLVCEGGEVGRAAIWEAPLSECYYQKALHRLRPTYGFNTYLMLALLRYLADHGLLTNYVTQTSIAHLTREKLADVPIPLPPILEQQAIALSLSDTDALITACDRAITKKRNIKQGAMQQLLTGQKRLPDFSGEWEVKKLEEIADIKTGPFGSSLHEKDYVEDGTPIITVEHLSEKRVLHENLPMVSDADKKRLSAYILKTGDIVFSRVGSVDRNSLISYAEDGWLFSSRLLRIRVIPQNISSAYLSYHFHQESTKQRIRSVAVGQTMASLNTKILKNIEVILPPTFPEQKAIAQILSDMDAEIAALEKKRDKYKAVKQGMMQELLTGKTRLIDISVN